MDCRARSLARKDGSLKVLHMSLHPIQSLLSIMARLRDPAVGCPWDTLQNFKTIAPYTIEEAYEVADAIEKNDMDSLKNELGDLLLQVVFHAQMASEAGAFDFDDVVRGICNKMITRHPHVFGDANIDSAHAQTLHWEQIKAAERADKKMGILDDVPMALPALMRAEKLQKRAARVGFDWPDVAFVYDKIQEELAEVKEAGSQAHREEEIGDVLFVMANLARHYKVDPEDALRGANRKFERRFGYIEDSLKAAGTAWENTTLDEMEALWNAAKELEKDK